MKACSTRETYLMTEYSSVHPAERYSIPLYSSYPLISILLWSHCVPEKRIVYNHEQYVNNINYFIHVAHGNTIAFSDTYMDLTETTKKIQVTQKVKGILRLLPQHFQRKSLSIIINKFLLAEKGNKHPKFVTAE